MLMIQNRSIICVMVWVLVQLTAKIDWNVGHFLDKINTRRQFPIVPFFIFCSSGPNASTFTSSLPLCSHGVKQDQDLKGPTADLANDSQISGLNVTPGLTDLTLFKSWLLQYFWNIIISIWIINW